MNNELEKQAISTVKCRCQDTEVGSNLTCSVCQKTEGLRPSGANKVKPAKGVLSLAPHGISENINKILPLMTPLSIRPSNNFEDQLSDITANRNIKLENDGTNLYNGLHNNINIGGSDLTGLDGSNGITDKYAFISEAFKN